MNAHRPFSRAPRLAAILAALCLLPAAFSQTPVFLPLSSMFGGGGYTGVMKIQSQTPAITDATNIYLGTFTNVPCYAGTNPIVPLTPNNYLVTFTGASTALRFGVPPSTNVQNVLSLITNGLSAYTYQPPGSLNLGAGTNINLTTNQTSGQISIGVLTNFADPAGSATAALAVAEAATASASNSLAYALGATNAALLADLRQGTNAASAYASNLVAGLQSKAITNLQAGVHLSLPNSFGSISNDASGNTWIGWNGSYWFWQFDAAGDVTGPGIEALAAGNGSLGAGVINWDADGDMVFSNEITAAGAVLGASNAGLSYQSPPLGTTLVVTNGAARFYGGIWVNNLNIGASVAAGATNSALQDLSGNSLAFTAATNGNTWEISGGSNFAGNLSGAASGIIVNSNLTVMNGKLSGNAGGLTNLAASQLTGTAPLSVIPASVATTNSSGPLAFTNTANQFNGSFVNAGGYVRKEINILANRYAIQTTWPPWMAAVATALPMSPGQFGIWSFDIRDFAVSGFTNLVITAAIVASNAAPVLNNWEFAFVTNGFSGNFAGNFAVGPNNFPGYGVASNLGSISLTNQIPASALANGAGGTIGIYNSGTNTYWLLSLTITNHP